MTAIEQPLDWDTPPPPPKSEQTKPARLVNALKEKPGRWAYVGETYQSFKAAITKLGAEVRYERVDKNNIKLWARWPEDGQALAAVPDVDDAGGDVDEETTEPEQKPAGRCSSSRCIWTSTAASASAT